MGEGEKKVRKYILFHSDDDPYVPVTQGEFLKKRLDGDLIILSGQKNFSVSTDPKYNEFPELLEKILR